MTRTILRRSLKSTKEKIHNHDQWNHDDDDDDDEEWSTTDDDTGTWYDYSSEDDDLFFSDGVWDDSSSRSAIEPPPDFNPDINPNEINKEIAFLPPVHELEALSCLNEMQLKAMHHVVEKSRSESDAAYPRVVSKAKRCSYTESQVKQTLRYIRDVAPIIVHFHPDRVMQFFIKDTHYRNQFETGSSSGCLSRTTREGWENRLFNNIYSVGCPDFDRVKYGVLNIVNDPQGVKCCYGYGNSYLVLKKVRLRTSFANEDTSSARCRLSSCEYYCHVLDSFNDAEFKSVMDVANGVKIFADSNCISTYKEIQIHGPLGFADHVEHIVMNTSHKSNKSLMNQVEKFCAINGISWSWMETPKYS